MWDLANYKMRGSVDRKLLRGDIKDRGILTKSRPKTYSLNMGYEELDQVSKVGDDTAGFFAKIQLGRPKTE